jgi:hypothetical protein
MERPQQIVIGSDGVELLDQKCREVLWTFKWQDVKEIAAWKVDVFSRDILCTGFRILDEPTFHALNEEQSGLAELLRELHQRFGIRSVD